MTDNNINENVDSNSTNDTNENELLNEDESFDLDQTLANQDRYHNEFGYDTGALDLTSLSKEDRDILSETRPIHIERTDIPEETQAIHILTLERQKREKHKRVYKTIIILMLVCIGISIIGLIVNSQIKNRKNSSINATPVTTQEAVDQNEDSMSITEAEFPDGAFREWVLNQVDTNHDNLLSPDERNAVIILNISNDTRYTNLTGINYFPLLQALNISGTSINEINLSENTKLKNVDISSTGITTLDLSKNNELTELNVANSQINSIIFPENSQINSLNLQGTNLTCQTNENGFYNGCTINEPVIETAETAN